MFVEINCRINFVVGTIIISVVHYTHGSTNQDWGDENEKLPNTSDQVMIHTTGNLLK